MSQFTFSDNPSSRFSFKDYSRNNTGGGDGLPDRLKEYNQWLVTQHKAPVIPSSEWQQPENQLTFSEAKDEAEQVGGELGFCFAENRPFVGFDLDDVTVDGEFTDEVLGIVRRLDSYTEVSSSGNGLHIIAEGEHMDDYKSRSDLTECGHIEVYDDSRYFVLTGDVYDGHTSVKSRPTAVREVQDDHLPTEQTFWFTDQQTSENGRGLDGGDVDVTPVQVRRTIREYVKGADVDEEVLRLWNGSDEGRESTSEADMAFVKQLYFWCRGDQQLMDDCFRTSGRMRSKWDEVHSSDGATYGEMTIHEVCRSNSDTFEGRYVP